MTIAGVDVGGLDAEEAEAAVRRQLLAPLRHSLKVGFDGETWALPGAKLKVRADIDERGRTRGREEPGRWPADPARSATSPVARSTSRSRPSRLLRARDQPLRPQGRRRSRPRTARTRLSSPSADSLEVVAGKNGRKLRDNLLTRELEHAVLNAGAPHTIAARVHPTEPEVTSERGRRRVPVLPDPRPRSFTLRLWKDLKLAKTYTVAVGKEGLETPEGLYQSRKRKKTRPGTCRTPPGRATSRARRSRPVPTNPIKARWMAIFEGAGIHGTEETESLGSAASHGCVRMSIPDVEELYDQVEVGTPIFIG